jgi:hypothetical protein
MNRDGWKPHDGGRCPVGPLAMVEVQTLDGDTDAGEAHDFTWEHAQLGGFFPGWIVRYRVTQDALSDRLEALIAETPHE